MTPEARTRVWRELRPFVPLAAIVVAYAIVRAIYGAVAGSSGLLTPGGGVHGAAAGLALATLVLRFVALFVVPWVGVYRLVMRAARRWVDPPLRR